MAASKHAALHCVHFWYLTTCGTKLQAQMRQGSLQRMSGYRFDVMQLQVLRNTCPLSKIFSLWNSKKRSFFCEFFADTLPPYTHSFIRSKNIFTLNIMTLTFRELKMHNMVVLLFRKVERYYLRGIS